jgi:hypothetical protein
VPNRSVTHSAVSPYEAGHGRRAPLGPAVILASRT